MSSQITRDSIRRRNVGVTILELPCPHCPRVALGKDALDVQRALNIHVAKAHHSGRMMTSDVPPEWLPNRQRNFDSAAVLDRISMRLRHDARRSA